MSYYTDIMCKLTAMIGDGELTNEQFCTVRDYCESSASDDLIREMADEGIHVDEAVEVLTFQAGVY